MSDGITFWAEQELYRLKQMEWEQMAMMAYEDTWHREDIELMAAEEAARKIPAQQGRRISFSGVPR